MTFKCAGLAFVSKDLVLLAKRCSLYDGEPIDMPGFWGPLSGLIEGSEDPELCVIREVKEETGLDIKKESLQFQQTIDHFSKFKKAWVSFDFYISEVDTFPILNLNMENHGYGFFKIDHLKELEPMDDQVRDCIQKFYNNKNGKY